MSINRANAASYIVGTYGSGTGNLLEQSYVTATDSAGGLKEPIDEAAILLSVEYSDLSSFSIDDSNAKAFFTALRYSTLKRILSGLNAFTNVDVSAGQGVSVKGSQLVAKVERLLMIAAHEARLEGLVVATMDGSTSPSTAYRDMLTNGPVGYSLDFIEPENEGYA